MKVNQKRIAILMVAGAMLAAAPPGLADTTFGTKTALAAAAVQAQAGITDISEVDSDLLDKARQLLKRMSGVDVELQQAAEYQQSGILKLFTIVNDHEAARVTIEKDSGKITDFYVEFAREHLEKSFQEQLNKALLELAPSRKIAFDKVYRIGSPEQYTTMLQAGEYKMTKGVYGDEAWVRFENNKLDTVAVTVSANQINAKWLNAARNALLALGDKSAVFTKATRIKSYGTTVQDVYRLAYGNDAEVEMGAVTQRIYKVTVDTLRDAVLREETTEENSKARSAVHQKIAGMSNAKLLKSFSALAPKYTVYIRRAIPSPKIKTLKRPNLRRKGHRPSLANTTLRGHLEPEFLACGWQAELINRL